MRTEELEKLDTTRQGISNFTSLVSSSATRPTLIKYLQRTTGLDPLTCYKYVLDYYAKTDYNDSLFSEKIEEANLEEASYE